MAADHVIFEIQVEKKILEQVLNENKYLKENYDKISKTQDVIKNSKEENTKLKNEIENWQKINKELNQENNRLKGKIKKLEQTERINEEKERISDLDQTENKLLKMKLGKAETERNKIIEEYEKETAILEELLQDNSKLKKIEGDLNEATENLKNVNEELKKTKKQLIQSDAENRNLDKDNLNLELQVKKLSKKLRLEEERNKSNDLAHVECKLLKLKLHTIEKEKKYLLEEFERERKIITKQNKPRVVKLEENIKHLRKWIEHEARERRPRDTQEVKQLKDQIHSLENDKTDLIEGFELERRVFQKILRSNGSYNLHLP